MSDILNTSANVIEDEISFVGKGTPEIIIRDRDGNIVDQFKDHNLIVKIGRSELIKLISGGSAKTITKCSVGSGGAPAGSPFAPYTPADSDVALGTSVFIKTITSTTTDLVATNPKVTFSTTFTCTEVNSLVNEAALFFSDSTTMFARYCFKTVSLESTSGFSMDINWVIEF